MRRRGEKQPRVLILADDLTGAADCAGAFLGRAARIAVALRLDAPAAAEVLAVDLDTRSRSESTARRIVRRAFASGRARRADILFKKIDSTLRGHVAAELAAARSALGSKHPVLFAPAFPAQGRTVKRGRVYVNGAPLLRGDLLRRIGDDKGVVICNAESDSDLRAVARLGLSMRPRPLFVGSAGLAHALASALPRQRMHPRARSPHGPVVVVVGSASPVSARQANRLARIAPSKDLMLYRLEWRRAPTLGDVPLVRAFGRIAARQSRSAAYVLTGGETARAVLRARGVRAFRLLGEVEPGVPFGASIPGGSLVCTKAGGFGGPDTLVHCVSRLKREMRSS